ncbi:hypothetical protein [Nocardia otitidiscaviarum]|uniref:hypothetical protein n=1 Tax=Nocardia otitidiscaviarum TaxID=1823 RepID=UPI0004A6B72D|nr:hypothetical protein [Nocardia otitidiscaviarum]
MAVRVTGVGEYPNTFTYPDADNAVIGDGDHLAVVRDKDVLAIFHNAHWSRAEVVQEDTATG